MQNEIATILSEDHGSSSGHANPTANQSSSVTLNDHSNASPSSASNASSSGPPVSTTANNNNSSNSSSISSVGQASLSSHLKVKSEKKDTRPE